MTDIKLGRESQAIGPEAGRRWFRRDARRPPGELRRIAVGGALIIGTIIGYLLEQSSAC
jgi:uncharacterized protein YjeT (DUF2065 family)